MAGERWLFTQEQLANTPSRQCGIDAEKEKCYRQQAANFMQEMGQRLTVSQLCINTGIVYLHRFYMFQSFTKFHRNSMAQACLFLAAKVEEQPRKLEHVIKVAHMILHRDQPPLDTKSVDYLNQAQELVINENILLQTLGFELQVDHPHAHIVKTCNLIKAPKDLTQTSYFLATNSLHLTLMSLRYKPTFVACVCIHLACKWAKFRIPRSSAGKEWWYYVDKDMTAETLEEITQSFLAILDKCPNKFKKKLVSKSAKDDDFISLMQFPQEKKAKSEATATVTKDGSGTSLSPATSQVTLNHDSSPQATVTKNSSPASKPELGTSKPQMATTTTADGTIRRVKTESYLTSLTTKEYFERKERERKERERIEKERQKLVERKEVVQQQKEHDLLSVQSAGDKSETRQHTNIFDQMIGEKQRNENPVDVTDASVAPRIKHSLERSLAQHNYKERYHHKERAEKLPFSPEISKEQAKGGSHRPPSNQRPNPVVAGHQSRDPKQKSRVYDRRYPEHKQYPVTSKEYSKHDTTKSSASETKLKAAVQDTSLSVAESSPEKAPMEAKVQKLDPEEGEILDDDSPLGAQAQKGEKPANQHDGDRTYHHHHRERRLSGRHQSPGASLPTSGHTKVPGQEGRARHRSPRSTHPLAKEEPHIQAVRETKPVPPKYEVTVPEPTIKLPDIETLHNKALDEPALVKQATPEPGEIIEHGQKHHHKSSRSKGHKKDKHRDRESSHDSGSLKIRLDLKGMGAVPSSGKPAPTSSGDDRKKEIKLKIKPPVMGSGESKDGQDAAAGLKMKLKVPAVLSPVKGNGDASKSEAKEHHKSANAIKLTLSKDSQSGQFTAHGGSHKSHRHSSALEKGSSRKRPYSPSEVTPSTHHKLPRNDTGISERHHTNDLTASLLSDNATSSPLAAASGVVPPALVEDVQRQLHRLIEKKTEEIQQQKLVSSKKPHHDNLNNPKAAFPPAEPSHTLPHS